MEDCCHDAEDGQSQGLSVQSSTSYFEATQVEEDWFVSMAEMYGSGCLAWHCIFGEMRTRVLAAPDHGQRP